MPNGILPSQRLVQGLIEKPGGTVSLPAGQPNPVKGSSFTDVFGELIDSVNELGLESAQLEKAFVSGDPVELHEVMIKAEEAGIGIDLILEIRNKLVDAYNSLMRMPL